MPVEPVSHSTVFAVVRSALNSTESAINNTGKQKRWTEHDASLYFLFMYVLTPLTFSFDLKRSGRVRRCCTNAPSYIYTMSDCYFFLDTRHRGRAWLYKDIDNFIDTYCNQRRVFPPRLLNINAVHAGKKNYRLGIFLENLHLYRKALLATRNLQYHLLTVQSKHLQRHRRTCGYTYTHTYTRCMHTQNYVLLQKKIHHGEDQKHYFTSYT